ncbi:MAG: hypothetical protein Q9M30_03820, partial [Mariprofundaceae bacterium]|nr:hypothetical protein [Mariprofundaceae bacterium]
MDGPDKKSDAYIAAEGFEKDLFSKELEHIGKQRPHEPIDKGQLVGLAFSGGGIRSSTFALGVAQALARMGWLEKFHYLSTVSGGGYIGSSLTWMWHKLWGEGEESSFDCGEKFPYRKYHGHGNAEKDYSRPQALLRHLRQHSNYLTPGDGVTGASLAAVLLRGMLLSLLVYVIPLLALMQWLLASGCLGKVQETQGMVDIALSANVQDHVLYQWFQHGSFFGDVSTWQILVPGIEKSFGMPELLCWGLVGLGLFALLSVLYGLLTRIHLGNWFAYCSRRFFERNGGRLLKISALLLIVASLPYAAHVLDEYAAHAASSMSLGGLLGAFFSMSRVGKGTSGGGLVGILAPLALILLVYGLFLGLYLIAVALQGHVGWPVYAMGISVSLVLSFMVNINYISIHRYYRDRLMELFMPDVGKVLSGKAQAMAAEANGASLHSMGMNAAAKAPYHIINANMVTMDSPSAKLRARGGENFILSPLYCGSEATGWRESRSYMGGKMNLATAMAISGAAADPHGAPGGEGLLRNKSLALLMALLNVRLGYWAPNPDPKHKFLLNSPNWFAQGSKELTGHGMHEQARYVHLADGGHFENLALYELVRRRVSTIIVCDGAADGDYTFADFANFVEKVRVDFAAEVSMPSFLPMCPKPDRDEFGNLRNPYGADLA